ncbi:hypothetical protein EDD15DRAFT_183944 [Pisolithus albus]|nr:hypothetical protein EDD15DRAFT_183944 [Pisolithus albus]
MAPGGRCSVQLCSSCLVLAPLVLRRWLYLWSLGIWLWPKVAVCPLTGGVSRIYSPFDGVVLPGAAIRMNHPSHIVSCFCFWIGYSRRPTTSPHGVSRAFSVAVSDHVRDGKTSSTVALFKYVVVLEQHSKCILCIARYVVLGANNTLQWMTRGTATRRRQKPWLHRAVKVVT